MFGVLVEQAPCLLAEGNGESGEGERRAPAPQRRKPELNARTHARPVSTQDASDAVRLFCVFLFLLLFPSIRTTLQRADSTTEDFSYFHFFFT